ncbi:MAG: 5-methyltetrahydrofolate--homocysteine methyltransferase [Chitinophagia bacterium]|nr:5-methyltetrahydrofolate--homocysteine methyltransferase [Chitinophagia bacterium]
MTTNIQEALQHRILVIDGAMGTMIQRCKLEESDYRGERFTDWPSDLKGNNDLLCITRPDISSSSSSSNIAHPDRRPQAVSLADYGMSALALELNLAAAACARRAVDTYRQRHPGRKPGEGPWVAGAIGPMNKTLSLSPDVNNPGFRSISFDEVADAYREQVHGLVEGGVDILLIETIFDTLNAKAAIYAISRYFRETGRPELPLMISGTITDASGRTLSGQTLEAFWTSVEHATPLSIGLNCALGADQMRAHIEELSAIATCYTSAYPNAGLPNAMGEYDETPEQTAHHIEEWARSGFVNIVGGCCGTTPDHIRHIADHVRTLRPRERPQVETTTIT